MKLLCWNIRSFGHLGRRRQLVEYLCQEDIDIVGLQETIREDFSILELDGLSHHHFSWQCLPASGQSGGILLGFQEDYFSVEDMDHGEFFLSVSIMDRRVNPSWEVIIVYGPTDHGRFTDFLAELRNKAKRSTTPVVIMGDFNLIQGGSDKNSPNVDCLHMCLFNDCIADLSLREIARVGARVGGHVKGVVSLLIPHGGVTRLQYADDTMIMVEGSDLDIVNLKFLLLCFEAMSGLKINFDKTEVLVLDYSPVEKESIANNFNCRLPSFPISYLGMPMSNCRILVSGYDPLVGRVAS
ncbi:ABC transporter G family member 37 [Hordeum vulgare]|nr:ABC transporter G family member 37 [Hordeum vulgare]